MIGVNHANRDATHRRGSFALKIHYITVLDLNYICRKRYFHSGAGFAI